MSLLSVVIPTRHRPQILQKTLQYLAAQTITKELDVIVVHDGTDDADTKRMIETSSPLHCTYLTIPKAQQGTARNRGVEKTKAPLTLFIGDDILLEPNACEVHVRVHGNHEIRDTSLQAGAHVSRVSQLKSPSSSLVAVLGFTTWDPAVGITPVMLWLEKTGWQFGYAKIRAYAHRCLPQETQHRFTYTSHISLPTQVARQIPFREKITFYGWEDIEWGMRLRDTNIPLVYEPDAKGLHHHHIELSDSLERMETIGRSLKNVTALSPEFDRMPKGLKLLAYNVLSYLPTLRGKHAKAFLLGLRGSMV